jgi:hypothetical protein
MAYTTQQLDVLESAIAQGVTKVKYSDKEVEYRSLDDMIRLRNIMRQELGMSGGIASRRTLAEFSKGLD